MASFNDPSTELVELIAQSLDRSTFYAFRLAYKKLYERTYSEYVQRITSIGFLLAAHRLHLLQEVGNNDRIVKSLSQLHLRLGVHTIPSAGRNDLIFDRLRGRYVVAKPDAEVSNEKRRYEDDVTKQQAEAFNGGDDVATLTLIISKLRARSTIRLGNWQETKARGAIRPVHDGPKILNHDTGYAAGDGVVDDQGYATKIGRHPTHAFESVLRALSITRTPVKELTAGVYYQRKLETIEIANMLPRLTSYLRTGLQAALGALQSLDLAVTFWSCDSRHSTPSAWLYQFTNLCSGLERLVLTGERPPYWDAAKERHPPLQTLDFRGERYRESNQGWEDFLTNAYMPHLRHFTLQHAVIDPKDLSKFVEAHHATVSNIELRRNASNGQRWQPFLEQLSAQESLALEFIKMAWLEEWNEHYQPDSLVTFGGSGVMRCRRCWTRLTTPIDFANSDCAHTVTTFARGELSGRTMSTISYNTLTTFLSDFIKQGG